MAVDNTSMKAKIEDVKHDIKAIEHHAIKFANGSTYPLAKQCFQLWQMHLNKSTYQKYEEDTNANNTKS